MALACPDDAYGLSLTLIHYPQTSAWLYQSEIYAPGKQSHSPLGHERVEWKDRTWRLPNLFAGDLNLVEMWLEGQARLTGAMW
jgi:hypothetical protein